MQQYFTKVKWFKGYHKNTFPFTFVTSHVQNKMFETLGFILVCERLKPLKNTMNKNMNNIFK